MNEECEQLPCGMARGWELSEGRSLPCYEAGDDGFEVCSERCHLLLAVRPGRFLERAERRPAPRAS